MGSLKSSICHHCYTLYRTTQFLRQRYCSKRCAGIAKRQPVIDRIREKLTNINDPYDCWEWTAYRNAKGYGTIKIPPDRSTGYLVHRMMWSLTFGPIPDGLLVCHHCDNPPCANPRHLFLGTNVENQDDSKSKGRRYPHAKVTADDVRAIRTSTDPRPVLAERYGVSPALITIIRQRKVWRHIPD